MTPSTRRSRESLAYVNRGIEAVFQAMTTTASLVGISLLATLTVLLWRRRDRLAHDLMLALAATALSMYIGLGIQRSGFGVELAASSRYVYMGAAMLMPAFGVAVDQLVRITAPALWAARLLLIGATAMNLSALHSNGNDWANKAIAERNILELVAASPATSSVDPMVAPLFPQSPDVRLIDLPELIADGAIHPRAAATPEEQTLIDTALSQPAPP